MTESRPSRVFVVGSLNADHRVHVKRLPAAGETVLATGAAITAGGKGANQAVAAARAGAPTTIIGTVGDDVDGRLLQRALAEQDIDARRVRLVPDVATGRALITVDGEGENTIVVVAGANDCLNDTDIDEGLSAIGSGDLLLLQLETPEFLVRHAARVAAHAGATVIMNPTPAPEDASSLFDDVDILVVNEHELDHLGDDITSLARQSNCTVICTLGADGVDVTRRGGGVEHVAARDVDAVDTTAAGDTFIGYLAARLTLRPTDLLDAVDVAVMAAGVAVTRQGAIASIPYDHELACSTTLREERR
ncbi:ribokinase [Mycobacterium sp. 236(2023)]|uniref:ribokinase n=1 Tax=Mycobacterium sp. 236(2023) TaxID=3038163 RepID=UPI002415936F|nr:ribokinase [Mycobacterium sp. 236(2023)]MDG4663238.1 ribokinase [Mycobacterium sp. 236(2023)]